MIGQIHSLMSGGPKIPSSAVPEFVLHETPVAAHCRVDVDAALEQVGGDPDLLRQIAGMLVQVGPEWLDNFERHLHERDMASARRVAHSLRNSAENVGSQHVSAALSRLENATADGCRDEAISMWPECREQFLRLLESVESYLKINDSAVGLLKA